MLVVDYKKPNFLLYLTDFNSNQVAILKNLPVRTYDPKAKMWLVPELAVNSLTGLPVDAQWTSQAKRTGNHIKQALLALVDYKFGLNGDSPLYGHTELYSYQKVGVEFLRRAKRALLADDLGLGKSLMSLYALLSLGTTTNLILCPATLKLNWRNEFIKHTDIEPLVIAGNSKKRRELWQASSKFKIANYDLLAHDWNTLPKVWDGIIMDECVAVKTHKATRTKLVKKLKSSVRFGLSGVPVENNLLEFHSIMEAIRPEILPTVSRFKHRYITYGLDGKPFAYKNLFELHQLTSPFILRRKKEDVLKELPPKILIDVPLELPPAHKRTYNILRDNFISWLRSQPEGRWSNSVLTQLIKLRQFVEFPSLVGYNLSSPKLEWLLELFAEKRKIVVFSFFKESIKLLCEHFDSPFILTGDVPSDMRLDIVNRFNVADSGVLLSTDAGRFGLNIVGAYILVHFGHLYNPASMEQRIGRLHRLGQEHEVMVFDPYFVDTIDEGIREVFLRRGIEADEFMKGSEDVSLARLSKGDFERLVGGGQASWKRNVI